MKRTSRASLSLAALALLLAACRGSDDGAAAGRLSLVAYSTPKEAYEEIVPAFAKTSAGDGVTVAQSYGTSGDQARAVIAGLPADVAALSLEPDVTKLVDEKLVGEDWSATPTQGIVTRSVVALAVRPGNPKNIRGWADLVKPGIEVLTPNPFTSGGARWNVMAAYGAQIQQGSSEAQAVQYLEQLFRNVVVGQVRARVVAELHRRQGRCPDLLRERGDHRAAEGREARLRHPDETILIENPIAATMKGGDRARAFVAFATSPPAQRIFAEKGYRSVIEALVDKKRYPDPPQQFDIAKFGGWPAVMKKFFVPQDSVMQRIEESLGVSTR